MALSPRQVLAIKRSTSTINLWFGSVRSGKTHASLWEFLRRVAAHTGDGLILVVGINRNTVWRNMFLPMFSNKEFEVVAPHIHYREGAPSGTIFGKTFQVVGASDESSWLRIQGMTVAICLGDEVTAWPQSFYDMLESRLSLPNSWFLGTCNPGTSSHYLVKRVIGRARAGDPSYHVEKMLLRHNPFVAESVKERFARSYSGVFARRMLHAEWVAAEGAVYASWDQDTMTIPSRSLVYPGQEVRADDPRPRIVEVLSLGIDYGTQHPTAGELMALASDGRLYIIEEWSPNPGSRKLTDRQLADSLERWLASLDERGLTPRYIYADPAALSFREELKHRGIRTNRADNDVLNGISTVDSLITNGDLVVSRTARGLIDEVPGYRWDERASERGQTRVVDEHDDHVDALRYAVYSSRHLWRRRLNIQTPT